MKPMMLGGDVA